MYENRIGLIFASVRGSIFYGPSAIEGGIAQKSLRDEKTIIIFELGINEKKPRPTSN